MVPDFLIGRDVSWLVFGLIRQGDEHQIRRRGTRRIFDLNGIEVGIDVDTPYWVPIWGRGWSLTLQVDPEGCPVLRFKGNAIAARDDLVALRMIL